MSAPALGAIDFIDPDTVRLIAAAYIDEPALAPLADSAEDLAVLEQLEMMTSPRHRQWVPLPAGLTSDELLSPAHGFGWSYVNAAFCYTRATGNRFNGPERGAWYAAFGADAAATAQAEIAYHLGRELQATGLFENVTAYRELVAGFATRFHDLRPTPRHPALAGDVGTAYPTGQDLARTLLAAGGNGVLYPSARRAGGQCLAAFRPYLVQNVRLGTEWAFAWRGAPEPEITPRRSP